MKKILTLLSISLAIYSCTPKSEEGERNSGTVEFQKNSDQIEGQALNDSTADKSNGNGSEMTPSDATQENQGSETSGAAGQ